LQAIKFCALALQKKHRNAVAAQGIVRVIFE
jgi:hypothetical protein